MSVTQRPTAHRRELEELYRSRYGDFVRVATAISGSATNGTEAVQEAFAQALRSSAEFRGDAPLEAWVWRIVVNAARAERRRPGPEAAGAVERPSPNGHTEDKFGVRRWIAALPERQRLVVFLRYYADLDYRSIAVALGIEVGTVSATLSAAHAALRSCLKEVPQ
jgi:RNA polymerase sigma-70 factor (ECF subfamily)